MTGYSIKIVILALAAAVCCSAAVAPAWASPSVPVSLDSLAVDPVGHLLASGGAGTLDRADYLQQQAAAYSITPTVPKSRIPTNDHGWRRALVHTVYAGGYVFAARIGMRQGMQDDFRIMRLESAYAYDFVGHVYCANQLGFLFTSLNRWAGHSEKESRTRGAWWGAFGMLTFMEVLNGYVPGVRLDPLDIPANAIGAWLADGYLGLVDRHPHLEHFSLQYGWKSMDRLVNGKESSRLLGNAWHDYPNGRFGIGYHVGAVHRPFVTVFGTYTINSMDATKMKNQFGVGVELPVVAWTAPLLRRVPGGDGLVWLYTWLDKRFMMPVFYVQLLEINTPAWSRRSPFEE
jgi:hypothetical protein